VPASRDLDVTIEFMEGLVPAIRLRGRAAIIGRPLNATAVATPEGLKVDEHSRDLNRAARWFFYNLACSCSLIGNSTAPRFALEKALP